MTDTHGDGGDDGARRFTENLEEQARQRVEAITRAAALFLAHPTRVTIQDDRTFIIDLATLLIDNGWTSFVSECKRMHAGTTPTRSATTALTADLQTLKLALEAEWDRRRRARQREQVQAETGDGHGRALPFGMSVSESPLAILIPPTPEQVSAIVSRIVKASNKAGVQLLTTGSTLMGNMLSSHIVGEPLSHRLLPNKIDLTLLLMLNECLFSKELGENVNTVMPPTSVVSSVHGLLLQQLPALVTHTAIPWLNGVTIVDKPGYNRDRGIWYQPLDGGFVFPLAPTREEMEDAVAHVRDVYTASFKFASEADKANTIGSALMNIVQPGQDGRSPLVMVTKPEPRTGGTYLATILAMTGQGKMMSVKAWPDKEDERHKSMIAAMRTRPSAVIYDNISGLFEGPTAALMTSSPKLGGRILGVSDEEEFDIRCCMFASANNIQVSPELAERMNFIHLEAYLDDDERAIVRSGRPADVVDWCEPCHRPAVEALLTMVAWWISEGSPMGVKVLPGFHKTCATVGGILAACGIEGWLSNRAPEFMSRVIDMQEDEALPVIRVMWDIVGSDTFRPGELITEWAEHDREAALPIRTEDNPSPRTKSMRLGFWLKNRMGKWWEVSKGNKVRIVKLPDDKGGARWCLQSHGSQMGMFET